MVMDMEELGSVVNISSYGSITILQLIKDPDLLVGGTIENSEELHQIYESGQGVIKVIVTPETINDEF